MAVQRCGLSKSMTALKPQVSKSTTSTLSVSTNLVDIENLLDLDCTFSIIPLCQTRILRASELPPNLQCSAGSGYRHTAIMVELRLLNNNIRICTGFERLSQWVKH